MSSRLERTSSRGMSPTTLRRVVAATFERGAGEVLHREHRHLRVDDLVEDDEVDRDRGVVAGDRGLVGDLEVLLPQVDQWSRSVTGLMQHEPRALGCRLTRPSRNRTIRWYSRTIRTDIAPTTRTTNATTPMTIPMIILVLPLAPRLENHGDDGR